MAEISGARVVARQVKRMGIDTAFGVVAGPMIEVMAAMQDEGIKVVGCRHEESAAFMASAWGYLKKKPGVIVVGSGPALTNAVTPMYVATESSMPLVVLGGSVVSRTRGLGGFQEANQISYAAPGCKFTVSVDSAGRIPELLHVALGKAVSGRPGAVYVDFPGEVPQEKIEEDEVQYRDEASLLGVPYPDPAGVAKVAELLSSAQRPLILIGKGAAWADATEGLTRLVNLGIPFIASPMGRGVVPDDSPYCVNAARTHALRNADAIVMVGGRFNWIFQFGKPPRYDERVRIAQIDVSAEEMYSSAHIDVGLVADAAVASSAIADALGGATLNPAVQSWLSDLREISAKNGAAIAEQMESDEQPINHYRLVREVRDAAPRESVLTADGELTMGVTRVLLNGYHPRRMLNSGTTGCMGTGLPYAIGAKLALPEVPAIAVLGDYAFGAAAIDIETAARVGANVVIVVSNNGGIAGHGIQDRMFGAESPPIAALMPANYEKMMEAVGGDAVRIEDPAELRPALDRAIANDRLTLLNVMTDPKGGRRGSMYLG